MEEWRPIHGFDGYAVSSEGRVYSWKTKKQKDVRANRKYGIHLIVSLSKDGQEHSCSVAKLMLVAFDRVRLADYDFMIPLFLDGVPSHVKLSNLSFKISRARRANQASREWRWMGGGQVI